MSNKIEIRQTIKPYKKKIEIEGDKSLSIRWALLASQSIGKSTSTNLLRSEDVLNTINCLKKLGVKIYLFKNKCEIYGTGINGYKYPMILQKIFNNYFFINDQIWISKNFDRIFSGYCFYPH